ncbi:MAG: AlpA family transcriptional regulator [Deltaproteobacteria bacterium]|nr:AlpA family transcriptional regulator [Deltaproteobacteria bacterium]
MTHVILRLPAVRVATGLSRSTIYARVAEGSFPKPISLGSRAVGWIEAEVQHWLTERIAYTRRAAGGGPNG